MANLTEELIQKSDKELLEIYFAYGGKIQKDGFASPMAIDLETSYCSNSLTILMARKSGGKLIEKLHQRFIKGEVNEEGQ